jgi:hypothetical protein
MINKSVIVDIKIREPTARLLLLHSPSSKLSYNRNKALAIYQQQIKKLSKNPQDKADVIKSESKLQALQHVDYTKNLTKDQQKMLEDHPIKYFIPWRAVWKSNSVSTPCRIVFDASQATSSGLSLNITYYRKEGTI